MEIVKKVLYKISKNLIKITLILNGKSVNSDSITKNLKQVLIIKNQLKKDDIIFELLNLPCIVLNLYASF